MIIDETGLDLSWLVEYLDDNGLPEPDSAGLYRFERPDGGIILIDRSTVEHLTSKAPTPSQRSLDKLLAQVASARIACYIAQIDGTLERETIAEIRDPSAIEALKATLAIRDGDGGHCMCMGDSQLLLYDADGEQVADLSVHHGHSVRVRGWRSDAVLVNGRALLEWIHEHGQAALDARLHAIDFMRWQSKTPECLRGHIDYDQAVCGDDEFFNELAQHLEHGIPEPCERARTLLEWYGHGTRWNDSRAHEDVARQLLLRQSCEIAITALEAESATSELFEGAARYFSSQESLSRALPDVFAARLLQFVEQRRDPEKIARAQDAFGTGARPKVALELLELDWTRIRDVSMPQGAAHLPEHPWASYLGWIERLAWWDDLLVVSAASIALRHVVDEHGSLLDNGNAVRAAAVAVEAWARCPCRMHESTATIARKSCLAAKTDSRLGFSVTARDRVRDAGWWLTRAASGARIERALESAKASMEALASIYAGAPERARQFAARHPEDDLYVRRAEERLSSIVREELGSRLRAQREQ